MRRALLLAALAALLVAPACRAWTWPASGPVLAPFVFDPDHPYDGGQHRGIDIGGDAGAPVLAPASGTVAFAGTVPGSGLALTIDTSDGYAVTLTHLGTAAVDKGATVAEGDVVGTIGPTGDPEVSGPYVHLGIRIASDAQGYLDPLSLLPARPVPPPAPEPAPQPAPAPPASAPAQDAPQAPAAAPEPGDPPPAAPAVSPAASAAPRAAAPVPAASTVPAAAPAPPVHVASTPAPAAAKPAGARSQAGGLTLRAAPAAHPARRVAHPAPRVAHPVTPVPAPAVARPASTVRAPAVSVPAAAGKAPRPTHSSVVRTTAAQRSAGPRPHRVPTHRGVHPPHVSAPIRPAAVRVAPPEVVAAAPAAAVRPARRRLDPPRPAGAAGQGGAGRLPVLTVAAALLAAILASGLAIGARIIVRREPVPQEDPRRAGVAVRGGSPPPRACGGLRRAVGCVRALPPAARGRRAHGQRDGRARHAGHGRRRPGGEAVRGDRGLLQRSVPRGLQAAGPVVRLLLEDDHAEPRLRDARPVQDALRARRDRREAAARVLLAVGAHAAGPLHRGDVPDLRLPRGARRPV